MGQGVEIVDGKIINKNPATGEVISKVPCTPLGDLDIMVALAKAAQAEWTAMTATERIALLKKGIEKLSTESTKLQGSLFSALGMVI